MKNLSLITIAVLYLGLSACGRKNQPNNSNHIKVGVESGPEYTVAQAAQKVAKEKYGLDVELVQFSDYVMPNEALSQGDIALPGCAGKAARLQICDTWKHLCLSFGGLFQKD
jgi:D-methionine transport system substrate-binding protein